MMPEPIGDTTAPLLGRYATFVTSHARSVLCVSLLATAAVVTGATRLVVDLDPQKQLPGDHPYVVVDRKIRAEFGGTNVVAIAVVPTSGTIWQRDVLRVVYDLTAEMLNARGVIRQNVLSLSSPYVRVPIDRDGVLTMDSLMKEVPEDGAGITLLRARYAGEPLLRHAFVSDDEHAALILVDFYDDVTSAQIADTIDQAIARHRAAQWDIAVTGAPIFDTVQSRIVGTQGYYFAGTVIAILLVLYLAFGQMQGVILPAATALLSTLWALGIMGFTGITLNPWTSAVPIVVMTVAAGHSAQMLKRYYEEHRRLGDRCAAVIAAAERVGAVMVAAGGTAGCGFLALSVLRIQTLTQFGVGVASGIFAAVALEMTFMLAVRALWPTGKATGDNGLLSRALTVFVDPLTRAVTRWPLHVVVGFTVVACAAIAGYPRLSTEYSTRGYWSPRTQVGHDLSIFERYFPGTTTFTILLEGPPGSMKTPEAIRVMIGLQQAMADDPAVAYTMSVADIIQRTYEVFAGNEAAPGLPMDPALIAQLFFLSESPAFQGYVDVPYGRAVVRGFLKSEDSHETRRVLGRLRTYLEQHPPQHIRVSLAGGIGPTLLALNEHTVVGKTLNVLILLLVIFLITSGLLRSALGGAFVVAPLLMALVVDLGLFAWSGIAFDLSGASIAAVGAGIGADYAIYFLYRLREEFRATPDFDSALRTTLETSGRAVLFVALAMSAGFAVYLLADFYPLTVCGIFIPLTMLVSCLTTLALLPALIVLVHPRFIFAAAQPRRPGSPTHDPSVAGSIAA